METVNNYIKWDQIGEKKFKTGVDHGVLYPQKNGEYPKGVGWSGLTAVNKNPSGAEDNKTYADNMLYANIKSTEVLNITIECLIYPDEFEDCIGEAPLADGVVIGQQSRNTFGFCYRNLLGNDTQSTDYGYELNLIYGGSASPSEQSNSTINDAPELANFSYDVSTTPVPVSGVDAEGRPYKPTASLTINSTKVPSDKLRELEKILYGVEGVYVKTTDTEMESGKKYYELVNKNYVETIDTTFASGKEYYDCTKEPIYGRLPLPDEVKMIFAAG